VLRLAPDAFWRLTPRELACAAAGGDRRAAAPPRAALAALMDRFPDHTS